MQLHLIRNATSILEYAGRRLIVDPCLDPARAWEPVEGIANPQRNPLCELPLEAEQVVAGVDGLLLTHRHIDHFDAAGARLLPRTLPVACQPEDRSPLEEAGFAAVQVCDAESRSWLGLEVTGTVGHHSNGPSRALLAPVSGFLLRADGEPTTWIVGDSVWCPEVEEQLARFAPDVVVVNAGHAQQLDGEQITMGIAEVERVLEAAPDAVVVAVHLEALGHCTLSRVDLRTALDRFGDRLRVPEDGEVVEL